MSWMVAERRYTRTFSRRPSPLNVTVTFDAARLSQECSRGVEALNTTSGAPCDSVGLSSSLP